MLAHKRVSRMPLLKTIHVESPNPPRIEFDGETLSWYVRFRSTKVVRTIPLRCHPEIATVDLDSNSRVVGIELLGVREFSIARLERIPGIDTSRIDFSKACFMAAKQARNLVPA